MKKHNIVKVILITLLVMAVLTWIIPAGGFSEKFVDQGLMQVGLFDLFNYPLTSLSYFGYIALFILIIGGFYGVLYKIPAYRNILDKVVSKVMGHEELFISILMIVLAVLVSVCGLQLGLLIFFPLIVSIILLMGYDKIVAALVLVGSTCVGLAGTTYAYNNISVLLQGFAIDNIGKRIEIRIIILLIGLALLIFNTIKYMRNNKKVIKQIKKEEKIEEVKEVKVEKVSSTKKKTTKSTKKKTTKSKKNLAALKDEDVIISSETDLDDDNIPTVSASKSTLWPMIVGLVLLFVVLVLAFIPWSSSFGIKLFEDVTTATTKFEIFKFPIFAKILGNANPFGGWAITDMILVLFLLIGLLSFLYKIKFNDVLDGFANGAKRAIKPALVVLLIYTILVLNTYHPFYMTIYKFVFGFSKGFNIITTVIGALLCGLFNVDLMYSFNSIIPYYASLVTNNDKYVLAQAIFQSIYGLSMLVLPTSVVLMVVLSYLNINFKDWLKNIWKFALEFLAVLLVLFIILSTVWK